MRKSLDTNNPHEGKTGVCMLAVVPVRIAPQEQSEMLSQLIFGEYYIVVEILEKWIKIRTAFDQFSGWIDRKFFREADSEEGIADPLESVLYSKICEIEMPDGSTQLIPAGCNLPNYQHPNRQFTLGKQKYSVRSLTGELLLPPGQKIFETASRFMHAPYLWGGKTVFGFDCSGFMQTVHKIHRHSLPRDTSHQVMAGDAVPRLKNSVPGDLAFFCNEEGKVNHVGMVLPGDQIIHCSGWVRIDRLDEKGILNRESGVYTHLFKEVRRV